MRPRRGRSFFERLRQVGRPPGGASGSGSAGDGPSYDFLEGYTGSDGSPAPARARPVPTRGLLAVDEPGQAGGAELLDGELVHAAPSYLERALAVFNASEYPRRVAGVARSLGVPTVNVRSAEHLESVVRIVVAWELCWYRYEVDLSEEPAEAQVVAQGTELSELAVEEREGNALAGDAGALALAAV
jgi:hypothetical protein